jgi:hypothetical protein
MFQDAGSTGMRDLQPFKKSNAIASDPNVVSGFHAVVDADT